VTRYVLSAQLGPDDKAPISTAPDEQLAHLDFLDDAHVLRHGVGRVLRDLKQLNLQPSAIGLDLLMIAVMVHAADTRINRSQVSQDNWTREIRLVVPVSNPDRWNDCRPLLSSTLRFLTGDLWDVTFRHWSTHVPHPITAKLSIGSSTTFNSVSLFSGGLDSLIGAIDSLEGGPAPLFASHAGDGSVSSPQAQLFAALAKQYAPKVGVQRLRMAMRLEDAAISGIDSENSTRGRSFLFFALGAMAGSAFGKEFTLRVPENGLISLNVPLDSTRLGSTSTRTTHPYYIHRWNELLKYIGLPCTIYNPYWNKTKGEMIRDCSNRDVLKGLAQFSVSCAHPSYKRYAQDEVDHCGTCVPCIIRRAAFASSPIADPTAYRVKNLSKQTSDATTAEAQQVRAFQYALSRLDQNPHVAALWIHKPGPLLEDVDKLQALVGVYTRGMAEVKTLLKQK
jgi:hypothetical protein